MKEVKRYRLKINLPDGAKTGDVYEKGVHYYWNTRIHNEATAIDEGHRWDTWQVEDNPAFFEEIKINPEVSKEWEVIHLEHKEAISFWSSRRGYTLDEIKKDGWNIYCVRRLSDNEVFTVGDELCGLGYYSDETHKITSMQLINGTIGLNYGNGGAIIIQVAKKSKSKDVFTWVDNKCEMCGEDVTKVPLCKGDGKGNKRTHALGGIVKHFVFLQKDMDWFGKKIPAGTRYVQHGADYYWPVINGAHCPWGQVDFMTVKNNPYFSTDEPVTNTERIEVSVDRYKEYADPRIKSTAIVIRPKGYHGIAEWQLPLIKESIESVLNNDDGLPLPKDYASTDNISIVDKKGNFVKYTQQQMDKAIEYAFNASRDGLPNFFSVGEYPTLNDYLNSLKK